MDGLSASYIKEVGHSFRQAKTLLAAVELGLFTMLAPRPMTGTELVQALNLHPRANPDFFDALLALRLLERDGDGPDARYGNTPETSTFLDRRRPEYLGALLDMANERSYGHWGRLTKALKTGQPQVEGTRDGAGRFDVLYSDAARCEKFVDAMAASSAAAATALAAVFDFSSYRSACDVGGASGLLSMTLARANPHLQCTSLDLPAVTRIAERRIAEAGLEDRVAAQSMDIFAEPLPQADVVTMGMILHDWNLETKLQLIHAAYDALPTGGALIVMENMIDDARRDKPAPLLLSLQMLLEFGDAFDFTAADLFGWCRGVGFRSTELIPLAGNMSAGVAYK